METLLTPLVNRLLDKFVKKSQEGNAPKFKASLSGVRGFVLHNLELDLASVIPAALLVSHRAFARSLKIRIPWTGLNTQPIEVELDTVEIILSDASDQELSPEESINAVVVDPSEGTHAPSAGDGRNLRGRGRGWLTGASWLGSNLQSLAMRAGLNVTISIKNVLVKYIHKKELALAIMWDELQVANVDIGQWEAMVDRPEAWLMKNCEIINFRIGLGPMGDDPRSFSPLMHLTSLAVSALLPIFYYVEGKELGEDDAKVAVQVVMGSLISTVDDGQVLCLLSVVDDIHETTLRSRGLSSMELEDQSHGEGQMKALGVFSKIWDVAVDEASYLQHLEQQQGIAVVEEQEQGQQQALPAPPMQAELTMSVNLLQIEVGKSVRFIAAEVEPLATLARAGTTVILPFLRLEVSNILARTASMGSSMQEIELQVENASLRRNIGCDGIMALPSLDFPLHESVWDEIAGIHPCDVPLRSSGRLRGSSSALVLQKTLESDGDDATSSCIIHIGKIFGASPGPLQHQIRLFMAALPFSGSPNPDAPSTEPNQNTTSDSVPYQGTLEQEQRQSSPLLSSLSSTAWEVDIDAFQLAVPSPSADAATLVLASADVTSYRSATAYSDNPSYYTGFSCSFTISIAEGQWQPRADRTVGAGFELKTIPLGKPITMQGGLGLYPNVPFLSVSEIDIEISGAQLTAVAAAAEAAKNGTMAASTIQPFPLLSAANRIYLSIPRGIQIDKNPKEDSMSGIISTLLLSVAMHGAMANVDCTGFSYSSSASQDSIALGIDLVYVVVDHAKTIAMSPPPAILVNDVSFSKSGTHGSAFEFGSLNIMALPSTMDAFMNLVGGFVSPFPPEMAAAAKPPPATTTDSRQVPLEPEQRPSPSAFKFNMVSVSIFPPSARGFVGKDGLPVGLTGWAATCAVQQEPSLRAQLGDMEIGLCRLQSDGSIEGAAVKVLTFNRRKAPSPPVCSVSAEEDASKKRRFIADVVSMNVHVTPELLDTIGGLRMPLSFTPLSPPPSPSATPLFFSQEMAPSSMPSQLLHGSTTIGGIFVEAASFQRWAAHAPHPQSPPPPLPQICSLLVSIEEAFLLFDQQSILEGRPWLYDMSAVASTTTITLLGVGAKVAGHAGGIGANSTQILLPADIQVHHHRWGPSGSVVAAVETQILDVKVSKVVVEAMQDLATAFATTMPRGTSASAAAAAQEEQPGPFEAIEAASLTDDLRSGPFTLAGMDRRLVPFGVVFSRHDAGEGSVEWRYPYPRNVGCILIKAAPLPILRAPLSLSRLDDGTGDTIEDVELCAMPIDTGSISGICFYPTRRLPTGSCWRLAWTLDPTTNAHDDLLHRLYINPNCHSWLMEFAGDAPGQLPSPPFVASMTLLTSIGSVDLALLPALGMADCNVPSAHVLHKLGALRIENLLGALHRWDDAFCVDTAMAVRAEYTESITLCTATLVEEFKLSFCYEVGSEASVDEQEEGDNPFTVLNHHAASGGFAAAQDYMKTLKLATRPYPRGSQPLILCGTMTPVVINISDLAVHDLHRKLILASGGSDGVKAPMPPPIRISNHTGLDIMVRQSGASYQVLGDGESSDFGFVPPRLHPGLALSLQCALNTTSQARILWSDPIDVMTVGGASIALKGPSGAMATIAVQARREGATWEVRLQNGIKVFNRKEKALDVLLIHTNTTHFVKVEPQGSAQVPLVAGATLRFWLGDAWSAQLNLASHSGGEVKVLGSDEEFRFQHAQLSISKDSGPVIANVGGVDPCTGHIIVGVWPPLSLTNQLPHPVIVNETVLPPLQSTEIYTGIAGGQVARIRYQEIAGKASESRSVTLFCPPLGDDSNSLLTPHAAVDDSIADNLVYIVAPGKAAAFALFKDDATSRLPCYLLTEAPEMSPSLSLQLIPHWSAVNKLSMPVRIHIPGCPFMEIAPNTRIPLDLSESTSYAATLSLFFADTRYSSAKFSVDSALDSLCRMTSKVEDGSPRDSAGHPPLQLAVKVKEKEVGSYAAIEIEVSPGFYVCNNTEGTLRVRESSVLGEAFSKETFTIQPRSSLPFLAVPAHLEVAYNDEQIWHAFPVPFGREAALPRRFYVGDSHARLMLTYASVFSNSVERLVIYRDQDPPVVFQNKTKHTLDLTWTSWGDLMAIKLEPGTSIELEVDGADTNGSLKEAEDSFGSSYARDHQYRQSSAGGTIFVRPFGDEELHELLLEEAELETDSLHIFINRRGPGLDITVEELAAKRPIEVSSLLAIVHVRELSLRLQDDERGRLTGNESVLPTSILAFSVTEIDMEVSKASESHRQAFAVTLRVKNIGCNICYPVEQPFLRSLDSSGMIHIGAVLSHIATGQSTCLKDASLVLPPFSLNVDDSCVDLYNRYKVLLQKPQSFADALAKTPTRELAANSEIALETLDLGAKRIYIENLDIGKLSASADIHLSPSKSGLPVAIDTDKSPVAISRFVARNISLPVRSLVEGITTHVVAEAVLNAPQIIGSLQLFFNPTGLVQSIRRGVTSMIDLPLQGLQRGPLQFIAGVGQGSMSMVRELSGWSVSSVVGFSKVASKAIFFRSSTTRRISSSETEATVTITSRPDVYGFARLGEHLSTSSMPIGEVLLHSEAEQVVIYQGESSSGNQAAFQLSRPVVILATNAIVLYGDQGLTPSLLGWFHEASVSASGGTLHINCRHAAPFSDMDASGAAIIVAQFHKTAWTRVAPSVRTLIKLHECK